MIISAVDMNSDPRAWRARAAREFFAKHGPADLQPLPLGYAERERLKDGSVRHILAHYARSLAELNYDVETHPSFYEYACGWMASPVTRNLSAASDPELRRRFPPHPLEGLDNHLYWKPPKQASKPLRSRRAAKALAS